MTSKIFFWCVDMNKFYYYDVLITYMHMFYFNPSLNCITIYEQVYEYLGEMISTIDVFWDPWWLD
jgi:hypothetical protein